MLGCYVTLAHAHRGGRMEVRFQRINVIPFCASFRLQCAGVMASYMGREPQARCSHAAVSSNRHMLVWGSDDRSMLPASTVETFDVLSATWREPRQFGGESLHDGLWDMAIAQDGDKAYSFGGFAGPHRTSDLIEIELTSLHCRHLVPAADSAPSPSARNDSAMVYYRRKLVAYGGYTERRWSDELHVFDLNTNTWTAPATTGEKPPPLAGHTLTMIDQHKAVLFGGYDGSNRLNDAYLLDMETWQWSKMRSGKKPPGRYYHAACVIGDTITGQHPLVMVVGGVGYHNAVLSDVWFLDVTNGSWTEVSLPADITGRWGHSAVVFGTGPDFRVVVLFGGKLSGGLISKTTLLLLSQKRVSWVVDRVVGPELLHEQDDELRDQLSRLQISNPLTDERAQQIIDKALESSSLPVKNVVAVLTGLMGSGKTWFLARLFNQKPPDLYTSTGIAEQSCRGLLHRIGNISLESWELFSPRKVLEYLACRFHEDLPPANVAQLAANIATLGIQADSTPTSASLPAPSTSVPKATPTPLTKSDTSQSMVRLVKAPQGSKSLAMLELVHMIDTGGQPEFMENMPSLVYNCHLAVLILNLMFGLDEYPAIYYHEKGKAYKRDLPSQYSNRQIIQKLASTLQAKRFSRKERQCFRLLVVATHRDCVPQGELAARVKAFNKALERILLPSNKAELIRFSAQEIAFVLNLKEPDSTDLEKLGLIRDKVSESGVGEEVEMPSSFLIFEQELVEFVKKMACSNVLSLEQCLQVGSELKMESDVVKAALIFFHRQITLLYFRYVLPNVVFAKPQVPLDFINSIVQFSYKVASGEEKGVTDDLISSLRDGIITEETLSHDIFKKCFIPDLYEAHHAIDLLCHTFTLAPLSREPQLKAGGSPAVMPTPSTSISREKREYLMMSLRPAILDKDIPQYIPLSSEIAPLVVKFSKDCVPLSCFSSTISCLLSMYDWRLSRADNGCPECLTHNAVSLFKPQTPGQIVLVDVGHSFQIHINADKDTDRKDFPEICFQVKETIFTAIGQVFDRLNLTGIEVSPAFPCPCSGEELFPEHKPSKEGVSEKETSPREPRTHSASTYLFKNKWFLHCSKTEKSVGAGLEKHTMWLNTPVAEKDKPSLPKLLRFKVPQKVGAQYLDFGCFLLNDEDGSLIEAMEVDQKKCENIVRKTLTEWLKGRGKPVTWNALVETLRECELNTFADHISEKTQ